MTTRIKTIEKKLIEWINLAEKQYEEKIDIKYDIDRANKIINIYYDGTAYEIINYYFSDGYNLFGLGEKFDNLLDNTSFSMERETNSHITFYQD